MAIGKRIYDSDTAVGVVFAGAVAASIGAILGGARVAPLWMAIPVGAALFAPLLSLGLLLRWRLAGEASGGRPHGVLAHEAWEAQFYAYFLLVPLGIVPEPRTADGIAASVGCSALAAACAWRARTAKRRFLTALAEKAQAERKARAAAEAAAALVPPPPLPAPITMEEAFENVPPGTARITFMAYGDTVLLREGESLSDLPQGTLVARLGRAFNKKHGQA